MFKSRKEIYGTLNIITQLNESLWLINLLTYSKIYACPCCSKEKKEQRSYNLIVILTWFIYRLAKSCLLFMGTRDLIHVLMIVMNFICNLNHITVTSKSACDIKPVTVHYCFDVGGFSQRSEDPLLVNWLCYSPHFEGNKIIRSADCCSVSLFKGEITKNVTPVHAQLLTV